MIAEKGPGNLNRRSPFGTKSLFDEGTKKIPIHNRLRGDSSRKVSSVNRKTAHQGRYNTSSYAGGHISLGSVFGKNRTSGEGGAIARRRGVSQNHTRVRTEITLKAGDSRKIKRKGSHPSTKRGKELGKKKKK